MAKKVATENVQSVPTGAVDVRTVTDDELHVMHSKSILVLQGARKQYDVVMNEMRRRAVPKEQ